METITINTGLKKFLLIDTIDFVGPDQIKGRKQFLHMPVYTAIESLAQLGALHVRYMNHFKKHAFLLKINQVTCNSTQLKDGEYHLNGSLESSSSNAFLYTLRAENKQDGIIGRFTFAVSDYSTEFNQDILEDHYSQVFQCLTRDLKID